PSLPHCSAPRCFFYSFLTPRRLPCSTLFPYTTLFRSISFLASDVDAGGGKLLLAGGAPKVTGNDEERMLLALTKIIASSMRSSSDRKSKRLNSSHVEISYAVFCLKKKKVEDLAMKMSI